MIFNPRGNMHADAKKRDFLSKYRTKKGTPLSIEDGFELFVSDHFGVMTEFQFKDTPAVIGGKRKRKYTFKRYKKNKKFLTRRR
jgi:hypothetical protein